MNKNIFIRILGTTAFLIWIVAGVLSLIDGEYFDAIGLFCLGFSMFVFPQWYKKNQS